MKFVVLALCLVAVVSARPGGRGGDEGGRGDKKPNPIGGLVKLCVYLAEQAEKRDLDLTAAFEKLAPVCTQILADLENKMDGDKATESSPTERGLEDDADKLYGGLVMMCKALGGFIENYASDEKRGQDEWETIFGDLVQICMAVKEGEEQKAQQSQTRGVEEDATNLVMGLIQLCGGVKQYVDAYGIQTGKQRGDMLLGAVVNVCQAVEAELASVEERSMEAGSGSGDRTTGKPKMGGDDDGGEPDVVEVLVKVCEGFAKMAAQKPSEKRDLEAILGGMQEVCDAVAEALNAEK